MTKRAWTGAVEGKDLDSERIKLGFGLSETLEDILGMGLRKRIIIGLGMYSKEFALGRERKG